MGKLSWRNERYDSKLKFQNFTVFEFGIHMVFQSKQFQSWIFAYQQMWN